MQFTPNPFGKIVLATRNGCPKLFFFALFCAFCCLTTVTSFAQSSFLGAQCFAEKPNPDALDSIWVYTALLQEKDSLRLWLRIHTRLAYEKLYGKKKNIANGASRFGAGNYSIFFQRLLASARRFGAVPGSSCINFNQYLAFGRSFCWSMISARYHLASPE